MKRIVLIILSFVSMVHLFAQSLLINEIQVANIDQFIDPSYNYGGWIELYNPGTSNITLNGCTIRHTDSEGQITESTLSSNHGVVSPKGYSVLWFDHNSKDGYFGGKSTNQIPFKLDADGGLIEMLDSKGKVVNAIEYPACIARCSWMRKTNGAADFGWTSVPTPNASNNTSSIASSRLQAPSVSISGGTFNGGYSFTVTIPENCTLYYTTDGSSPDRQLSLKSKDGKFSGSNNIIYRFMLTRDGYLDSPVVTRSFFKYSSIYSLPILSVNTNPKNFFDNTIGLYVTGTNGRIDNNSKVKANQNMDWERPVNVEYFVPNANKKYEEAINQEANFSIFGGWTRFNPGNDDFDYRTPFKLKSDKVFEGKNSFPYPIFSSKPHIKIKNFLVRNGGQDKYARIWDAAIHELLRTSGVYIDCQAWQPTHVYLDGKYLGMMNLREESNKQFAFSNYGIEKEEIDQWEGDIVIKEGDRQKLNEWLSLSSNLASNPTSSSIWEKICNLVDIDEYCNYMAAEIYIGNMDWLRGGFKNLKGFRAKDEGGKFHLVLHDVDAGFGDTDMILQVINKGTGTMPVRFKNMLKYEPFKKQFIDAYCIMNGSVFDPERCIPIITAIKNTVNPALKLEGLSADEKADLLIERLSDREGRRAKLKQSLKTAFSLENEYNVTLQSNIPEAKLLLNGQEIPTGKFNGYLFAPIVLKSSAPEGYVFKEWQVNGSRASTNSQLRLSEYYKSAVYNIEAIYEQTKTDLLPIRINEVSAGNDIYINEYGKKADWVELYNASDKDYDLVGAFLSDDPQNAYKHQIKATDGVSTVIPAHGYKIIWCDGKDSQSQIHASFKLKNENDSFISITDASCSWTDYIYYKEQPRWSAYGRFPDGGHQVAMFERPTIDGSNRLLTNSVLEAAKSHPTGIDDAEVELADTDVVSVRYYNLRGQQISNVPSGQIVIQQTIYHDGSSKTRKVRMISK